MGGLKIGFISILSHDETGRMKKQHDYINK